MLPDTGGTTNSYSKYGAAGRLRFAALSHENAGINRANAALSEGAQRERKQVYAYGVDRHHKRSFQHQWALCGGRRSTGAASSASLPLHGGRVAKADTSSAAAHKICLSDGHIFFRQCRTHCRAHTPHRAPAHNGWPGAPLQIERAIRPVPLTFCGRQQVAP